MPYCRPCDRTFSSSDALRQHRNASSRHNFCEHCDRDFATYRALHTHRVESSRHNFCTLCDEDFESRDDLLEHKDETHEYCQECNLWLGTLGDMKSHDRVVHTYCTECKRGFTSLSNLDSHLNSSMHREKTVRCWGAGCNKMFGSRADLILHLETNTCASGITRKTIRQVAMEHDHDGLITSPRNNTAGPNQQSGTVWNGRSHECRSCHREFRAWVDLKKHLASPVHEQASYHCPRTAEGCGTEFKSLGAFFQHIESGSCGASGFRAIQNVVDRLLQGIKRVALR